MFTTELLRLVELEICIPVPVKLVSELVILIATADAAVCVATCCALSPAACASAIELVTTCCAIAFSRSEFLAISDKAKPMFGAPAVDFS
jgi:hypothetical protein